MQHVLTILAYVVFGSSIASLMLPPIETFNDYPRFQKAYKVVITIVTRWASLNLRNTFYSKYFANGSQQPPLPPASGN